MSTKRRVLLIEIDLPERWSSSELEAILRARLDDPRLVVWGAVDGVDAAYRKLLQLSRETEEGRLQDARVHSAHKALSFFQEMFPASFWKWKRIGGEHPDAVERRMMAGR